jgi:hypothetical protein
MTDNHSITVALPNPHQPEKKDISVLFENMTHILEMVNKSIK